MVNNIETKTVVVLDGKVIHVGELETLPDGAVVEQREMFYTLEHGWREVGWEPEESEIDKLKADLTYIAIMAGVEL